MRFPVHYHEGESFNVSLDNVQFKVPEVNPGGHAKAVGLQHILILGQLSSNHLSLECWYLHYPQKGVAFEISLSNFACNNGSRCLIDLPFLGHLFTNPPCRSPAIFHTIFRRMACLPLLRPNPMPTHCGIKD